MEAIGHGGEQGGIVGRRRVRPRAIAPGRLGQDASQLGLLQRFAQRVYRTQAERFGQTLVRIEDVGILRGHPDPGRCRGRESPIPAPRQLGHQARAVEPGHRDVAEHHVERLRGEPVQRGRAIVGFHDLRRAECAQHVGGHRALECVVFHQKNAQRGNRRGHTERGRREERCGDGTPASSLVMQSQRIL